MIGDFVFSFSLAIAVDVDEKLCNFNKICVSSDSLVVSYDLRNVKFIGNVKLFHDKIFTTSDTLKIFFSNSISSVDFLEFMAFKLIKKFVFNGDVRIKFDNKLIVADTIMYVVDDGVVSIIGVPSSIFFRGNVVVGEKIIYDVYNDRLVIQTKDKCKIKVNSLIKDRFELID